jgi:hypothetical protein
VNFVEDDELNISNEIGALVKHAPENLGCHDQAAGFRVDLYISCEDSNIIKNLPEVSELLVTQCLYWRGIYGSISVLEQLMYPGAEIELSHMFSC